MVKEQEAAIQNLKDQIAQLESQVPELEIGPLDEIPNRYDFEFFET